MGCREVNNPAASTQTMILAQEKEKGKALEICALIFGVISLCGCCYGLFGEQAGGADKESDTSEELGVNKDSHKNPSLEAEMVGKVVIDGKEIRLPCKFSDIGDEFEYSELNGDVLNSGLGAYDSGVFHLASHGRETGIRLFVGNFKETVIEDINDADVLGVSANYYKDINVEVKFFNNISFNMSQADLENALNDINYDKEQNDSYDYYRFTAGKNNEIHFSILVADGKVLEIMVDYLGE